MKNLFTFLLALLISIYLFAQVNPSHSRVRGYANKRGTYVAPHERTKPNSTAKDNYSTKGNVNPYTGKKGTKPVKYNAPKKTKVVG